MVKQKTALLLPSAYRPLILKECLDSLFANTPRDKCDTFVSIFLDDRPSMDVISDYDLAGVTYRDRAEYDSGAIYGFHKLLAYHPDYQYYVIASDDLIFHSNWYSAAKYAMRKMHGYGLVGFNDTHSDGNEYAGHFMVSRDFLIDWHGGEIFPPLYKSWWCDREITDIAKLHNCYTFAEDAVVEHRNHAWHGIKHDKIYADAELNYDRDYATYQRLKTSGFPVEWEPVLVR